MTEDPLPPYGSPAPTPAPAPDLEPGSGYAPEPSALPPNEQHITLVGGLRRSGRWVAPRQTTVACLIGGVDLDLRDAVLPAGEVVVQHLSVIGGVSVLVPSHVAVRVEGLRLVGGRSFQEAAGPTTTTLVIRSFGIIGGVEVRQV